MPVALVRRINDGGELYHGIFIWCPGCEETAADGTKYGGLHMLSISRYRQKSRKPIWTWNGDLVKVTLSPSILTKFQRNNQKFVCHSFLTNGVWQFLNDSTHDLKGSHVSMTELPDWITK